MADLGQTDVDVGGDLTPLRRDLAAFAKSHKIDVKVGFKIAPGAATELMADARKQVAKRKPVEIRAAMSITQKAVDAGIREARAKAAKRKPIDLRARLDIDGAEMRKSVTKAQRMMKTNPLLVPVTISEFDLAQEVIRKKELAEAILMADPLRIHTNVDESGALAGLRRVEARSEAMRRRMERPISIRIRTALRGLRNDLANIRVSFNQFIRTFVHGFNMISAVGAAAFVGLSGLAIAEFGKIEAAATQASMVFTGAFSAATGATGDALTVANEQIRGAVLETSKEVALQTKFNIEEVAEGVASLARAGVNLEESLQSAGVVAEFAQAANMDLGEAADQLARGFTASGQSASLFGEEVGTLADKLTLATNQAPITMMEALTAFTNGAAGTFAGFNQTIDETIGLITLLGRTGFVGAMAGTQASIMIRELERAGSSKAVKAWEELGIDLFDASNNMLPFSEILDQIAATLTELQKTEGDRALGMLIRRLDITERSARGLRNILPAIQQLQAEGSGAAALVASISDDSAGQLALRTQQLLATLGLQFENFLNGITTIAVNFAEPLAKVLTGFFVVVNSDLEKISEKSAAAASAVGLFGDKAEEISKKDIFTKMSQQARVLGQQVAGPLSSFLRDLAGQGGRDLFGGLTEGFSMLLSGIKGFFEEFANAMGGPDDPRSFLSTLGFLSQEFGRIALAVYPEVGRLLGEVVSFIRDNPDAVKRFAIGFVALAAAANAVSLVLLPLSSVFVSLSRVAGSVSGAFSSLVAWIRTLSAASSGGLLSTLRVVSSRFGLIGAAIAGGISILRGFVQEVRHASVASPEFSRSLRTIGDAVGWVSDMISTILQPAFEALEGTGRDLGAMFVGAVETMASSIEAIQDIFAIFDGDMQRFSDGMDQLFLNLGKTMIRPIQFAVAQILRLLAAVVDGAEESINQLGKLGGPLGMVTMKLFGEGAAGDGIRDAADAVMDFGMSAERTNQSLGTSGDLLDRMAREAERAAGRSQSAVEAIDLSALSAGLPQIPELDVDADFSNIGGELDEVKSAADAAKDAVEGMSEATFQSKLVSLLKEIGESGSEAFKATAAEAEVLRRGMPLLDAAIQRQRDFVQSLDSALQDLQGTQLEGTQAFDDAAFAIDQQIKKLELRKVDIEITGRTPEGTSIGLIDRQIEELRLKARRLDLRKSLELDPLKREIEQTFNPVEEMSFDSVISAFDKINAARDVAGKQLAAQEGLRGKIDEVVARTDDKFFDVGRNINLGIEKGLESTMSLLEKSAVKSGETVVGGFDQVFKFGSPSRTMFEQGVWVAQGFSGGMASLNEATLSQVRAHRSAIITIMRSGESPARDAGARVMRGFFFGMRDFWVDTVRPFILDIAEWIKENKGPIAYDAQLLRPAGEAIMGGFHRGLRDGFGEVQGWIRQVGPDLARHSIPDSVFKEMSAEFLIGNAKADLGFNPDEFFNSLLPGALGGAGVATADGVFGMSSGWMDTVKMSRLIGQVFDIIPNIASGARRVNNPAYNNAIGGAAGSLHLSGRAMDFGLAGTTASNLDRAAEWARGYLGTIFDEVLWRTTGHYDHLHLGWNAGTTKVFDHVLQDLAGASEAVEHALQKAAAKTNVPFGLLAGLAKAESGFNPMAVSPAGAQGLTQLMPGTARSVGVLNSFDPFQNAEGGAKYLARQLQAFGGDVRLALAAYNAGPGAARVAINSYPETMAYIERVLAFARQFGYRGFGGFRAQGGPTMPNTAYVVGERGPELFMSDRRGQVISNADMTAMISAMQQGRMPTAQQAPVVNNTVKVTTASKEPEVVGYLVARTQAQLMGRVQR